jgi:flavin reductase (DIM6/NTAB) family NADH-FMN oxidoreductase RutF
MAVLGERETAVMPATEREIAEHRARFIESMSHIVSGVSIVTTDGPVGRFGLTVSSFCSLDADPPMVLVCISQRSPILKAILQNKVLAVNVLADENAELADTFAGRPHTGSAYDFERASWSSGITRSPLLDGAVAYFDCDLAEHYEAATHAIFTAYVRDCHHQPATPLVYTSRTYGRPGPLLMATDPEFAEPAPREDME